MTLMGTVITFFTRFGGMVAVNDSKLDDLERECSTEKTRG